MASGDDAEVESRPPLTGAEAAGSQAPAEAAERPAEAVQRLRAEVDSSLCICILGGTAFQGSDSEELVKAIAGELVDSLSECAAFLTGGMTGVQKTFALHCGDGSRIWNILPVGESSGFGVGTDLHAGASLDQRREVFGLLGDLYVTVEGGPGVAQEARAAHERGAMVIPLMRTGGASSGMFDFPAEALERPPLATEEQWALLRSADAPVREAATATAAIVAAFAAARGRSPQAPVVDSETANEEAEEPLSAAEAAPDAPAADSAEERKPSPPAGLALSQPPEAPVEQGLGEDDVECDVEPMPPRDRASECEQASPRGSERSSGTPALPDGKVAGSGARSGPETGEADAASRARDLISRELLDELSHMPEDWNEGRSAAPTPSIAGFGTPSETRTPSPRATPRHQQQYYGTAPTHEMHQPVHNEGLMCIDQWDWKTDAPEFVPGSMKGLMDAGGAYQAAWAMPPSGRGGPESSPDGSTLGHMRVQFDWQLRTKSDEFRDMQNRYQQLEIETAQVRASWEMERRSLVRQIGHYRAVLERYCIPVDEAGGASFGAADEVNPYCVNFEPFAPPSQWGPGGGNGAPPTSPGGAGGGCSGGCSGGGCNSQGGSGYSGGNSGCYGGGQGESQSQGGGASGGNSAKSTQASSILDTKMRQLNSLLQQEGSSQSRRRPNSESVPEAGPAARESDAGGETAGGGYSSGSIASTLRAMFPHATIRTSRPDSNDEERDSNCAEDHQVSGDDAAMSEVKAVEHQVRRLETSTSCTVDDRAMRSLQNLSAKDAREALQKVEDLVFSQGGHCRNLSSILQSVCRKIEKRSGRTATARYVEDDAPRAGWSGHGAAATSTREAAQATRAAGAAAAAAAAAPSSSPHTSGVAGGTSADAPFSKRVRRLDEDGDAFDDSSLSDGKEDWQAANDGLVRTVSMQSQGSNVLDTPAGKRSWADMQDWQSGDEDEPREAGLPDEERPPPEAGPREDKALDAGPPGEEAPAAEPGEEETEHWTPQRIEKAARRGFELRRRGEHWDLKISMGRLDPPLTKTGMERYCRWLEVRLSSFREEYGPEPLRRCRGEVDFSHNNMNNDMVWMLLETLCKHQVHTALLKLFANRISRAGILAICEFIRANEAAEALQELHLSHNEIDDESALELLRVLGRHRPRYPPRRPCEGTGEYVLAPVWLRLNHNRIREPEHVRRFAEEEGITTCTAWDREACGTSKCCRRECPLVHLYSFNVQARHRHQEAQCQAKDSQQQLTSEPEEGNGGDQRGMRRKRNRKPGGSKDRKEPQDRDDAAEADVPTGLTETKGREAETTTRSDGRAPASGI